MSRILSAANRASGSETVVRSLCIASQKGGIGKSTLALNLAYALSSRGWRIALVDTDPQGGIGRSLIGDIANRPGLVECLAGEATVAESLIPTRVPELSILPVGRAAADRWAVWEPLLTDAEAMRGLLAEITPGFDLTLVDTPSGMHGITRQALRAADGILVPLQAEPLTLRTVADVLETVGKLREEGAQLIVTGFVLTMVNTSSEVSLEVVQEAWRSLPDALVLSAFLPRDDIFLKASASGTPLGLLSRRPPAAAVVFDQIATELESRLGWTLTGEDDGPIALVD